MKKILLIMAAMMACAVVLTLVFKYITVSPEKISNDIVPSSANSLPISEQNKNIINVPDMSFEEVKGKYAYSVLPTDINGKLAYVGANSDFTSFVIVVGNEEIKTPYAAILGIYNLDNKLAYIAQNKFGKDSEVFLVWNGQEFGKGKGYGEIRNPVSVNGKVAYWAKRGEDEFIFYDGQELSKGYDTVLYPQVADGKLVYIASKNNKIFLMPEGKQLGKDNETLLYNQQFVLINNIPAYVVNFYDPSKETLAYGRGVGEFYIVHGEEELGKEYYNITRLQSVGGKLAYVATNDGGSHIFIVYNGQKFGERYDNVWGPHDINGELAYMAEKNGKHFIVYNEQEIGKEYDDIMEESITTVNGKLVFTAKKNNQGIIVVEK